MKKALKVIGWTALILTGVIVYLWAWAEDVKSVQWVILGSCAAIYGAKVLQDRENQRHKHEAEQAECLRRVQRIEERLERISYQLDQARRGF